MALKRNAVLLLFAWMAIGSVSGQSDASDSSGKFIRKSSLIPIPIVYYTPETRWAGGLAALLTFRTRGQSDEIRPSQITLGFAYTQEKQVLLYLPFQFFSKDESWQTYGELGYYKYVYQYFGIGNDTRKADEESYDVTYPRLRVNVLKEIATHHYLGFRYWWDDYQIKSLMKGGLLEQNHTTGSRGGTISGAGLVWNFDSRDQLFYPRNGVWTEVELFFNRKELGSDFNFFRFSIDLAAMDPAIGESLTNPVGVLGFRPVRNRLCPPPWSANSWWQDRIRVNLSAIFACRGSSSQTSIPGTLVRIG